MTKPGEVIADRPRVFTLRIWNEVCADGIEHRGQVRDVASGAFRAFRTWLELTSFLTEHLGEIPSDPPPPPRLPRTSAHAPTQRRDHEQ